MKTLYLLRHAKASSDDHGITDFDRPLNERGYADAHLLSSHIADMNLPLDAILSSPSIRTISTALIFAIHLKFPVDKIQLRKRLYNTGLAEYIRCITEGSDEDHVLLVGHNETITEVAQQLSKHRIVEMKTCSFIALQFDAADWKDVPFSKGNLHLHLTPDMLKSM